MTNNSRFPFHFSLILILLLVMAGSSSGQNKPKHHPQPKKKATPTENVQNKTIIQFTPEQLEGFRQQSIEMVRFFEGTLNFLADKANLAKEKQTIITESYLKMFRDSKVQVEDDLDENRKVTLYKDIPAYLSDVNFFFKQAKFTYTVQDVAILTNDIGQTYFKVTANRNLTGVTVNGDSVNSNKVRYFEINYDDSRQQLMIVSIYTTKPNENDEMRNWWNRLSDGWKIAFGKDLRVNDTLTLDHLAEFDDSVAIVNGGKVKVDSIRVYNLLVQIIKQKEINISGNTSISSLDPLVKLSSLVSINISNTPVSDLTPLRNLNETEKLDCSGTLITTLETFAVCGSYKRAEAEKDTGKNHRQGGGLLRPGSAGHKQYTGRQP